MPNLFRLYYQFIPEGKEYPVLYRRSGVEESNWVKTILCYVKRDVGREEILLDWNEIAEQYGARLFLTSLLDKGVTLYFSFFKVVCACMINRLCACGDLSSFAGPQLSCIHT